jgi:hypothetical protein
LIPPLEELKILYVLEKFEEDEKRVIRRNCRDRKLRVSFGTYGPLSSDAQE